MSVAEFVPVATGRLAALIHAMQRLLKVETFIDIDVVCEELRNYASSVADGNHFDELRPYLFWSDVHYTRNLVFTCEKFEMMIICWGIGQGSRIHNHASSHCFMATLSGVVSEQRYLPVIGTDDNKLALVSPATVAADAAAESNPGDATSTAGVTQLASVGSPLMVLHNELMIRVGEVSHIDDAVALHRVANFHTSIHTPDHAPRPLTPYGSVTLHVYAPPIRRVSIFEPGQPTYARTPGFYSVNAVKH